MRVDFDKATMRLVERKKEALRSGKGLEEVFQERELKRIQTDAAFKQRTLADLEKITLESFEQDRQW